MISNIKISSSKIEDIKFIEELAKHDKPEGTIILESEVSATLWLKILKMLYKKEPNK